MANTYFIFEGKKRYVKKVVSKSVADFPFLKKEFLTKKNNIDPKLVPYRSQINFFWKCKKGHEFRVTPGNRFTHLSPSSKLKTKKFSKCPFCKNFKVSKDNNLKFLYPKIAEMWNYKKNILKPEEVYARSQNNFWWICSKNHEFEKKVYLMVDQKGFCGGCGKKDGSFKRFLTKDNSLEFKYPDLAKEWHPTKNGKLKPKDVIAAGNKKYWWKCPKGFDHEYQQSIYDKAITKRSKSGCPFCAFKILCKTNSLAYMYPEVAAQWHPTKNGKLTPNKVVAHAQKIKPWWKCKKNHEWKALVSSRTVNGTGCKKCTGVGISYMEIRIYSELIKIFSDIKWSYKISGYQCDLFIPQLKLGIEVDGVYWHKVQKRIDFDKKKNLFFKKRGIKLIRVRENGLPLLNPEMDINVSFDNNKKENINILLNKIKTLKNSKRNLREIKFYKKEKKFVNEKLYKAIRSNLPSPILENSLEYKRKDLVKEWDYKKNYPLVPSMFKLASQLLVWWLCKNKHSYQARIGNRSILKRNCPYCAGRYALPDFNLKTEHPNIVKEWNYELNKKKPEEFTPISGQHVWWNCSKGHIYRKAISHKTHKSKSTKTNRQCPCQTKHQNGELYKPTIFPLLRKEFSKKNKKKLSSYSLFDKSKLIWKCKNGHEYKNSIYRRIFYEERCFKCIDKVILLIRPLHDKNETKMLD